MDYGIGFPILPERLMVNATLSVNDYMDVSKLMITTLLRQCGTGLTGSHFALNFTIINNVGLVIKTSPLVFNPVL